MKNTTLKILTLSALAIAPLWSTPAPAAPAKKAPAKKAPAKPASDLVPLALKLPKPTFIGTPKNIPPGTTVEKPTGKPRPPYMVPKGTVNLALGKPVTASDTAPIIGEDTLITDGDKEAADGKFIEYGFGKQWVQVDLGKTATIYAIVSWHAHTEASVYHDVVVQISNDPDFVEGVTTVFNNDQDNSSGLGKGTDREYFELAEGKLMPVKGVKGRYVRFYSNGSTGGDENRYTEIEVYGK